MTEAKKAVKKPVVVSRPRINHGGKRIELPLLSGPVGQVTAEITADYPVSNAAADTAIVDYYLSLLAQISFLSQSCPPADKPDPKVIKAAETVQCWDTNRLAAVKAFQGRMDVPFTRLSKADRAKYDIEIKNGVMLPDGPTFMALVEFGDVAERLIEQKGLKKSPRDLIYYSSFDQTRFLEEFDKTFGKDSRFSLSKAYGSVNRAQLLTLLKFIILDPRVIDVRWMAYMLATALHETTHATFKQEPVLDKKGKPRVGKDGLVVTRRVQDGVSTMQPTDESGYGSGKAYFLSVKVTDNGDGTAHVIEPDGDIFLVSVNEPGKNFPSRGADPSLKGKKAAKPFQKDSGAEFAYFGRGYVQLTWWDNYARAGVALGRGLEFLLNPDRVNDPEIAYALMSHGMITGDGFANGHKLSNYISGAKCDYVGARAIVNGSDKAAEIAAAAKKFEAVLTAARTAP